MAKKKYTISIDEDIEKEFMKLLKSKSALKKSTWIEEKMREFIKENSE